MNGYLKDNKNRVSKTKSHNDLWIIIGCIRGSSNGTIVDSAIDIIGCYLYHALTTVEPLTVSAANDAHSTNCSAKGINGTISKNSDQWVITSNKTSYSLTHAKSSFFLHMLKCCFWLENCIFSHLLSSWKIVMTTPVSTLEFTMPY